MGKDREPIIPLYGVTNTENLFAQRIADGDNAVDVIRELFPEHSNPNDRKAKIWIRTTAQRWLTNPRIVNRLAVINEERRKSSIVTQQGMTDRLTAIVDFDMGELFTTDENGIERMKSMSEMTPAQRKLIKGFDKNGMPVLIDKEFAINKIIKVNGLESVQVSVHIGGKLGELLGGGARPQLPAQKVEVLESNPNAIDITDAEEIMDDDFATL